ncbi:hypothetical protein GCM10023215_66940 [Pseudonocardia yuanmonensis]|uniref:Uncharacterized protein n=1 Tax=Pseudonocardia yuanmonensis TaxID=1095914 RepID=A0ABP8XUP4_9PSEU
MQFINLLIVATVAFAAPLVVRLFPALRLPFPVLEILSGVELGPRRWAGCRSTSRSRSWP